MLDTKNKKSAPSGAIFYSGGSGRNVIRSATSACASTVTISVRYRFQNLLVVPLISFVGPFHFALLRSGPSVRFRLIALNTNKKIIREGDDSFISGGSGRNRTDTPFGT